MPEVFGFPGLMPLGEVFG